MNQRLVSSHFPYLPVRVYGREIHYEGDAVIDTGFDGGIVLPSDYKTVNVPSRRQSRWILGDGSPAEAPTYIGRVAVDSFPLLPFLIEITILGSEPIIGLQVIRHFSVILDRGRRVIVEP